MRVTGGDRAEETLQTFSWRSCLSCQSSSEIKLCVAQILQWDLLAN